MLQKVDQGLYVLKRELRLWGGGYFPGGMAVIVLAEGGLLLYSPIAIDDALAAELEALGPVRFILTPNRVHTSWAAATAERYPDAKLCVSPGVLSRRPELKPHGLLGEVQLPNEVQAVHIAGAPTLDEYVLLHEPTRSLLVADLVFNVRQTERFSVRFFMWLTGTWGKFAQSKSWRFFVKDKAAVAASAEAILALDFDRVVPCHGEVLESGGKKALEAAIWRIRGDKALGG